MLFHKDNESPRVQGDLILFFGEEKEDRVETFGRYLHTVQEFNVTLSLRFVYFFINIFSNLQPIFQP